LKPFLLFALGTILHPSVAVRDIDGVMREPLKVDKGHVEALFFVTNDCPVSNYYAHEIQRICEDYAKRGVGCALVYTDPAITDDQAREHAREYGHGAYPKIVDRAHALVKAAGATINPTAVLIKPDESIAYRGRIDNFYAAIGKTRRVVTEHDLRDALDAVIAGRPVAIPEAPSVGCYIQ
jgi:AhpC/TSA family